MSSTNELWATVERGGSGQLEAAEILLRRLALNWPMPVAPFTVRSVCTKIVKDNVGTVPGLTGS